jgi:hypothetical protein
LFQGFVVDVMTWVVFALMVVETAASVMLLVSI